MTVSNGGGFVQGEHHTLSYETPPPPAATRRPRAVRKIVFGTIPLLLGVTMTTSSIVAYVSGGSSDPTALIMLMLVGTFGAFVSFIWAAPLVVAIYWLLRQPVPAAPWFARWLRLAGEGRAIKVAHDVEEAPLELESADESSEREPHRADDARGKERD